MQATSDRVLVCIHDRSLERTTGSLGLIESVRAEMKHDLSSLRVDEVITDHPDQTAGLVT